MVGPDGKLYFPVMGTNEIWRVSLDGGTPEKVAGDLGVRVRRGGLVVGRVVDLERRVAVRAVFAAEGLVRQDRSVRGNGAEDIAIRVTQVKDRFLHGEGFAGARQHVQIERVHDPRNIATRTDAEHAIFEAMSAEMGMMSGPGMMMNPLAPDLDLEQAELDLVVAAGLHDERLYTEQSGNR